MAYNARKIVHDLFTSQGIPLLFTWYNDMCVAHDGLGRTIYSCAAAAGVAAAAAAWKKPNKDSNQKEQDSLIDLSRSLSDPQSLPFPPFVPSSLPSTRDNCVPKEDKGIVSRTIMMKPLTLVWSSYPTYSELNTVILRTAFSFLIAYTLLSLCRMPYSIFELNSSRLHNEVEQHQRRLLIALFYLLSYILRY